LETTLQLNPHRLLLRILIDIRTFGFRARSRIQIFLFFFLLLGTLRVDAMAQSAVKEARAIWVTRWQYTTGNNPVVHRRLIREIIKKAKESHFNMLIFQVRGQADAFYRSNYEPWAKELTGSLGVDPGWDPLQYALEKAHEAGLELHAWVNVYNMWRGETPPPSTEPEQMYNAHPDWIVVNSLGQPMQLNSSYVYASPGIPDVQDYLLTVFMDIVDRYDIDGLHLDYCRYPNQNYSWDEISRYRWQDPVEGNPQNLDWDEWRREQVNTLVRRLYQRINESKPWVRLSAAPLGRYNWPASGWDGYNVTFQDARQWMKEQVVDFISPQLYVPLGHPTPWHRFETLLGDWLRDGAFGRHVYPGITAHQTSLYTPDINMIKAQIDTVRQRAAPGQTYFSYGGLESNDFFSQIRASRYQTLANVPPMPWKDDIPPNPPREFAVSPVGTDALLLSWRAPEVAADGDSALYYNIYRSVGAPIDLEDPGLLYQITGRNVTSFVDGPVDLNVNYTYWITALDKGNNESEPTGMITTGVAAPRFSEVPKGYWLGQNYPNPFGAMESSVPSSAASGGLSAGPGGSESASFRKRETRIEFELGGTRPQRVELRVYNSLGREVKTLLDGVRPPGRYSVTWDGTDNSGNALPSGVYLYVLRTERFKESRRMLLLR
jgi:uncharacterized lipoprotein YddW (UPF0748 family)